LLEQVAPSLSQRMLDELERQEVLSAELRIAVDGSVQDAVLLTRVSHATQRALLSALAQWRFEPLPQSTQHRVELVFNR
jgi:hypothetical protein